MNERDQMTAPTGKAANQGAKPGTIARLVLDAGYTVPRGVMDLQRDPGDEDDYQRRDP